MSKKDHLEELHDRVVKTTTCRFFAHDRLKAHHQFSIWTISLFSLGLILIPLMEAFSLNLYAEANTIKFIQVSLALVVLVFSILINSSNYSVRAEKNHQCGLLLNAFCRKVHKALASKDNENYDQLVNDYDAILQKFENHAPVDYLFMKNHLIDYYTNPWWFRIYIRFRWLYGFIPYIILLSLEVVVFEILLYPSV